jgi:hypothetical protein
MLLPISDRVEMYSIPLEYSWVYSIPLEYSWVCLLQSA